MRNRKRIKPHKLKKGDVVRATEAGVAIDHIYFILEDEKEGSHVQCLPVCNLTGSKFPTGGYFFDLSQYNLPSSWFRKEKPNTWLWCKEVACIHKLQVVKQFGNIINSHPKLWAEICRAFHSCPIAEKFKSACDCEFEIIEKQIDLGYIEEGDCGCNS